MIRKPTERRDDLYRGYAVPPAFRVEARADTTTEGGTASGSLMFGHFALFDVWTEIRSYWEGDFLERIAAGAFRKTIKERRSRLKVQFDHGYDTEVGSAPLGPITDLREDAEGVYYEVPLVDTDYNRDRILPLLQGRLMDGRMTGSLLGASFRFSVLKDEWVMEPGVSTDNPTGLPERTIKEVRLYEFGPVVFPAYADATAGVRSLTDHYLDLRSRRSGEPPAGTDADTTPPGAGDDPETTGPAADDEPADRHSGYPLQLALARRVRLSL